MIKITVLLPEKISTNAIYSGLHYRVRKKQADLFHKQMLEFKNKYEITHYPVDIIYLFYFKGKLLDSSNCSYMAKLIEDGMIKIGLLKNDSPKFVRVITLRSMKSKKKFDYCEIIMS